jgi:hypothetical protein
MHSAEVRLRLACKCLVLASAAWEHIGVCDAVAFAAVVCTSSPRCAYRLHVLRRRDRPYRAQVYLPLHLHMQACSRDRDLDARILGEHMRAC